MTKRVEVTTELTAETLHEKYHKVKDTVERTLITARALALLWGKKFDGQGFALPFHGFDTIIYGIFNDV